MIPKSVMNKKIIFYHWDSIRFFNEMVYQIIKKKTVYFKTLHYKNWKSNFYPV